MKRIVVAGLLALAVVGLGHSQASAICFDVYRPCVRLPLPRLPIFLPKISIGCDPEGKQNGCCNKGQLLFNRSCCATHGGHQGHGCGYPNAHGCAADCNRPMYPNPGMGYNCWNGAVGPWYTYWPPNAPQGYQVGMYGGFRGPAHMPNAPVAPTGYGHPSVAYNNVPAYWYGR